MLEIHREVQTRIQGISLFKSWSCERNKVSYLVKASQVPELMNLIRSLNENYMERIIVDISSNNLEIAYIKIFLDEKEMFTQNIQDEEESSFIVLDMSSTTLKSQEKSSL
jgi:hypothetical protein